MPEREFYQNRTLKKKNLTPISDLASFEVYISFCIQIIQDIKQLEEDFEARPVQKAFATFATCSKNDPKHFKNFAEYPNIYPNDWAPIILSERGHRVIRPMRYRLRPHWAKEDLPMKYSLFTARLDKLNVSRMWSSVFMKNHGVLVFKSFMEWVSDPETGARALLSFRPKDQKYMYSPVIFDKSHIENTTEILLSFALITHEPTPEILAAGYDRCPIFLKKENIDTWLNPKAKIMEAMFNLLKDQTPAYFEHKKMTKRT